MAANANIVVNNNAAVAKTFVMEQTGQTPGYRSWAEKSLGVFSQFPRLFTKVSMASANRTTNRQDFGTTVPVVRPVNSVSTVIGNIRIVTQLVAPVDATDTEVKDAFSFHRNGLSNALIQGQMRDGDFIS